MIGKTIVPEVAKKLNTLVIASLYEKEEAVGGIQVRMIQ